MDRRDTHDSSVFAVPGQLILDLGANIDGHSAAMELAREAAHKAYCLIVVADAAPAPNTKQRDLLQPKLDALLKHTFATAIVIQGSGIEATTKRTLVRVMASFSHARKPFRVFSDVAKSLVWLREEAASRGHEAFGDEQVPRSLGAERASSSTA